MIVETLTIDRRFRGPAQSGNGGYVCGRIARHVLGTATVRLAIPPPLDTPLHIDLTDGVARLMSGTTLVGEGRAAELDIDAPAPVSFEAATQSSKRFHRFRAPHVSKLLRLRPATGAWRWPAHLRRTDARR